MTHKTYTIEDLRTLLNITCEERGTLRRLKVLEIKHDFPPPVRGLKVWSAVRVDQWILQAGEPASGLAVHFPDPALTKLRETLEERYA